MSAISPELLMRFADNELSLPERRLVEERLASDPQARALLATFQGQREQLLEAYADFDDQPGLARCERAIDHAFQQRRRRQRQQEIRRWALPIAASLLMTFVGGLFAMHYADQRIATETARLAAEQARSSELAFQTRIEALERMISGKTLTWTNKGSGSSGSITPLRTFQGKDGQWCREYRETNSSIASSEQRLSIACREGDGLWNPPI